MKSIFGMFNGVDEKDKDLERSNYADWDIEDENYDDTDIQNSTLELRKEELDITKNRIQSGEVILSKDIIEEKKVVDVPLKREEVVIERRSISNEATDHPITNEETIRIPVSKEEIEVGKHTVITGEVSAHRREIEDVRRVEENLKREEARINSEGAAEIVDNDINSFH